MTTIVKKMSLLVKKCQKDAVSYTWQKFAKITHLVTHSGINRSDFVCTNNDQVITWLTIAIET